MDPVAFDCETWLIEPGLLAPPLVCLTLAWTGSPPEWVPTHDPAGGVEHDGDSALLTADAVSPAVVRGLLSGLAVAANAPYDLLVLAAHAADPPPGATWAAEDLLPDIFDALAAGRVSDVQVRERLLLNAVGALAHARVSLADLVYRYLGEEPGRALKATKGPDTWRTRYAELDGVPLDEWPDAARAYAIDDARLTLRVWAAQGADRDEAGYPLVRAGRVVSEDRELRAAWALHLQSAWGLRTDAAAVDALLEEWTATADAGRTAGLAGGWVRGPGTKPASKVGTLDKKVLQSVVSAAYGGHPPRTTPTKTYPAGSVRIDTDTLLEAATRPGAPDALRGYADSLRAAKYLSVWGETLRRGVTTPIQPRYTHLVATGRVAAANPPIQQPPRAGGVRECFVPRPGYLLCSVDYDTAELCALAQVLIWMGLGDTLARAINGGLDVHCLTGEAIARAEGRSEYTYTRLVGTRKTDPVAAHYRQLAKVANFGFPGGLGAARFVEYAAGQDVVVTPEAAALLREAWMAAWPEMRGYFALVNRLLGDVGSMTVQHPVSGRLRGGVGYTDGCNGYFQGLVADGAKAACWDLARAAYVDRSSAFYGARPVVMLHDEVIAEVPEDRASDAAEEMARVMRAALQAHVPDVVIRAEPALMARWYKSAATVRDADGRVVTWVPPTSGVRGGQ